MIIDTIDEVGFSDNRAAAAAGFGFVNEDRTAISHSPGSIFNILFPADNLLGPRGPDGERI